MTESNSEVISQNSPNSTSNNIIISQLPDINIPATGSMMRVQQRLDLLLLALEALQLGCSEYMLAVSQELELDDVIKNRLSLWRLRCSNPWRKCYTRESLSLIEAKTLALITVESARRFMLPIRQLLLAVQQMKDKDMPLENNFRLSQYFTRFKSHFTARMNPGRAKVSVYLYSPDELNQLSLSLLEELLFCTGSRGRERFWVSLFDGEVN